jgi:hypothetical protein
MYRVGENLTSDLLQEDIGQMEDCPIVMVGHSFGGLVVKQLFCHAHDKLHESRDGFEKDRLRKFLGNIRGILYYATPHRGSQLVDKMAKTEANPLLEYFQTLSTEAARLNSKFDQISGQYGKLDIFGLGEGLKTKLVQTPFPFNPSIRLVRLCRIHFYTEVTDLDFVFECL